MKTLALAVALALTPVMASATTVSITDFNNPAIGTHGDVWTWNSGTASPPRTLGVNLSNTGNDYLIEVLGYPYKDIAGTTALELTGQWFPSGDDGHFLVDLFAGGTRLARATYTYGQFAGGVTTVSAPLVWQPSVPTTVMDIWELVGDGNSGTAFGDLALTSMVAVPEPSTYAMALAGLACGGFSMWRRRKQA